jgi:hypothetical protein
LVFSVQLLDRAPNSRTAPPLAVPESYVGSPRRRPRRSASADRTTSTLETFAWAATVFTGLVVGSSLIYRAYAGAQVAGPSQNDYLLFWIGTIVTFVPIWMVGMLVPVSVGSRQLLVGIIGLAAFYPKLLREPTAPLFHDELAHWSATNLLIHTGDPFAQNAVVPIIRYFPGLHTLTAVITEATGMSTWHSGLLVLSLCHITSTLGIYELGRMVWTRNVPAFLAAAIFAIGPQFAFADGFFAYESFAVPLAIWAFVCALRVATCSTGRIRWSLAAAICALCCVITHHLTTYELAFCLLLGVAALLIYRHSRVAAYRLGLCAIFLIVLAIAWVDLLHIPIVTYLAGFPKTAVGALGPIADKIIGHTSSRNLGAASSAGGVPATRSLFAGSTLPSYERFASFASVIAAGIIGTVGTVLLLRKRNFLTVLPLSNFRPELSW